MDDVQEQIQQLIERVGIKEFLMLVASEFRENNGDSAYLRSIADSVEEIATSLKGELS